MPKTPISEFLLKEKKFVSHLIDTLSEDFDYVSVLGTDVKGLSFNLSDKSRNFQDSQWGERGFVIRLFKKGVVSEHAFNTFADRDVSRIKQNILNAATAQPNGHKVLTYTPPIEDAISNSYQHDVEIDPLTTDVSDLFDRLDQVKNTIMKKSDRVINARCGYEGVRVSKIFLSKDKDLSQAFTWSQAYAIPYVKKGERVMMLYHTGGGMGGVETLTQIEEGVDQLVKDAESLLESEKIIPGEYDVICAPDVSGLIAHEAFGHGVETDMFVRKRAKANDFMDQAVASPLVSMKDGARSASQVASYFFDDEGSFGSDTTIIENGILKNGLSDYLSACQLDIPKTGNGRRESYARKAYARMTNTFFMPGKDSLEDMIASIQNGYLIEYYTSGMEDPKNWGIQAIALLGREIQNGTFTGKVVSPIIMTGYVPDVLKAVSMVSETVKLSGAGFCGKGYKEFVKVSSGGPYIKTKMRLG